MDVKERATQFRSFLILLWAIFVLSAFWIAVCLFVAKIFMSFVTSIGEGI